MKSLAGLALVLFATRAGAQAPEPSPSPHPEVAAARAGGADEAEMAALLDVLSEETDVATKTRMNGDFVPGIVTVLHGDELEAMGVETVGEALGLVPGIQAILDSSGTPSVLVRGVDFPFNSGNVKVLIDSVPLSRESAGINGILLQTPVGLVDRIEVIRGPGSVVYGDFAFMGLVNVITRRGGVRPFARFGGEDAVAAGGHFSWKDQQGRTEVSASLAGWTNDEGPVSAPRAADEQRGFGSFTLRHGGLRLTGEAITRDLDQTAGAAAGSVTSDQTHWGVDARYERELRDELRSELRLSHRDNTFRTSIQTFEGAVSELGLDLHWEGWRRHAWLVGVSGSMGTIARATATYPAPPPGPPGAPPRPVPPPIRLEDEERNVLSVVVQDRFDVTEKVSFTAGARFDRYSDLESRLTPRVSLALRPGERHILKLQYAEGFRAPTFFEQYPTGRRNEGLDFEVNATTELNYVHRRTRSVLRATLFHSRLKDMIFVARGNTFSNSRKARAFGAELEWEQQVGERLKLTANASWVDEEEDRGIPQVLHASPAAAEWLGNVAVLFRATRRTLLAARLHHVGDRHLPTDPEGFDIVDLALTRSDLLAEGLQLRAGVKNVFDDEVRYVTVLPDRNIVSTFPGRTFWVQVSLTR